MKLCIRNPNHEPFIGTLHCEVPKQSSGNIPPKWIHPASGAVGIVVPSDDLATDKLFAFMPRLAGQQKLVVTEKELEEAPAHLDSFLSAGDPQLHPALVDDLNAAIPVPMRLTGIEPPGDATDFVQRAERLEQIKIDEGQPTETTLMKIQHCNALSIRVHVRFATANRDEFVDLFLTASTGSPYVRVHSNWNRYDHAHGFDTPYAYRGFHFGEPIGGEQPGTTTHVAMVHEGRMGEGESARLDFVVNCTDQDRDESFPVVNLWPVCFAKDMEFRHVEPTGYAMPEVQGGNFPPLHGAPNAGSTGAQNAFIHNGMLVHAVQPDEASFDAFDAMVRSCVSHRRPQLFREKNGEVVQAKDHPDCFTWSKRPDHRHGVDFLGKLKPASGEPWFPQYSPWGTEDDQHVQVERELSVLAMTDDPVLRMVLEARWQVDRMGSRFKYNQSGASRAAGRLIKEWLRALPLVGAEARGNLLTLIANKVRSVDADALKGSALWVHEAFTDPRIIIGKQTWIPWQLAILAQALDAVADHPLVVDQDTSGIASELAARFGAAVLDYGYYRKEDGTLDCAHGVRWIDGETTIPSDSYDDPTKWTTGGGTDLHPGSSYDHWANPLAWVVLRFDREHPGLLKESTIERAREIAYRTPLIDQTSWRDAEFFAVDDPDVVWGPRVGAPVGAGE